MRRHQDARRRTVADLDQPGALKRDQRLADCRAGLHRIELEVALRRQAITRLELALEDFTLEMRGNLLEELASIDEKRFYHRPFIPSCLTTTRFYHLA